MPATLLEQMLPFLAQAEEAIEKSFFFPRGIEAADVVQDVAARLAKMPPRIRPELEKYLVKFLKRCCFNRAKDYWRGWKRYEPRHCSHEEEVHPSKQRTPLQVLASRDALREIARRLTPEQLDVASLLAQGYTIAEIAIKTGRKEAAVRMRLKAARKRLLNGVA